MQDKDPRFLLLLRCAVILAALSGTMGLAFHAIAAPRESVASVTSRPGVTQDYYLIEPDGKPRAIAVLFVGGEGELGLENSGPTKGTGNFLMRVRRQLAAAGFVLVYPDTPSDRRSGLGSFRTTPQHAEDIAAVVKAVKARADLPVFLIGTSRGTISAANGAARLPAGAVTGLVLTSTITVRGNKGQASIYDVPVKDIKLPVFALAHRNDGCYVTPPDTLPAMLNAMPAAARKDSLVLEGGAGRRGDACGAQSPHGYLGIEDQAAKAITDWIEAILASR